MHHEKTVHVVTIRLHLAVTPVSLSHRHPRIQLTSIITTASTSGSATSWNPEHLGKVDTRLLPDSISHITHASGLSAPCVRPSERHGRAYLVKSANFVLGRISYTKIFYFAMVESWYVTGCFFLPG